MNHRDDPNTAIARAAAMSLGLRALAVIVAVGGLVVAGAIAGIGSGGSVSMAACVVVALVGVSLAALLWTAGWVVQQVGPVIATKASGAESVFDVASLAGVAPAAETPPSEPVAPPPSPSLEPADQIEQAAQRANELMAAGRFHLAKQIAEHISVRFPQSEQAQALARHVAPEADAFARQRRRQLFEQVDHACANRQWAAGVRAAQQLLTEYPDCPEAAQVAMRFETLEANAHIAAARELRDQVRDLIERRRYGEAVATAEDLIGRFGETQAAGELRGQLERLRDLASRS